MPSQNGVRLKPAPGIRWPSLGLHPSFARLVTLSLAPHCVGPDGFDCAPPLSVSTYPRGPRSGSGYSVLIHHHLIGPIRPTRGHIAISPHGGLYAMPSLCGSASATRERFRAFAVHSFLTCRPLRRPGSSTSISSRQRCRHRPSPKEQRLGTPEVPAIRFTRGEVFEASTVHTFATACQFARHPARI